MHYGILHSFDVLFEIVNTIIIVYTSVWLTSINGSKAIFCN